MKNKMINETIQFTNQTIGTLQIAEFTPSIWMLVVRGGGSWLGWFDLSGTEIIQWILILVLFILYWRRWSYKKC